MFRLHSIPAFFLGSLFLFSFFFLSCTRERTIVEPVSQPVVYIDHFVVADCDSTLHTMLDSTNVFFSNPNNGDPFFWDEPLLFTTDRTVLRGVAYKWRSAFDLSYDSTTQRHIITGITVRNIPAALNGCVSMMHIDRATDSVTTTNLFIRPAPLPGTNEIYAHQVQSLIYRMARANLSVRRMGGGGVGGLDQLIQLGLMPQQDTLYSQWIFSFIGGPVNQIQAVSTDAMPGGEGKVVVFSLGNEIWEGFGIPQEN